MHSFFYCMTCENPASGLHALELTLLHSYDQLSYMYLVTLGSFCGTLRGFGYRLMIVLLHKQPTNSTCLP